MGNNDDLYRFLEEWHNGSPFIEVHTSGSTGAAKKMFVEKARMEVSARMTCDFLNLCEGDHALLCMPLQYIAGKMMVVRSLVRRLHLITVSPSSHPLKDVSQSIDFAAMVPLQVIKTLECPDEAAAFERIGNVIIGGGAIDDSLEQKLRIMPNAVWSTYGMTETLSHIAMRRVSGQCASYWYTPLDGIEIALSNRGTLVIKAPALCAETLITNDVAEINDKGQFRILGRSDNTINSGGIKIQIEEVERVLHNLLNDYSISERIRITSRPDSVFGEIVCLLIESGLSEMQKQSITCALDALPRYWRPKITIEVASLPMTATGKPDRFASKKLAEPKTFN